MTQIIAPLAPVTAGDFIHRCRQAQEQGADMLELRLDVALQAGAQAQELLGAISQCSLPVLVTCRHPAEGGAFAGSEAERLQLLLDADAAGAAAIDVELLALDALPRRPSRAQLIVSYHDFDGMGSDLSQRLDAMYAGGADIGKIAVTPLDAADLGVLEQLCQRHSQKPLMVIGMGEIGLPSRLLAGAWGCSHTFARLAEDAQGSAPGQPTIGQLRDDYRLGQQTRDTLIFGVIGNPIAHSLSPAIHNAALAHDGIDGVYVPFLVEDPVHFWRACHGWIDGLSITIPHKAALLEDTFANEDLAQAIGAINTLYRNREGQVIGANTDAEAALECVSAVHGEVAGARALVLGAGGVARAVCFALHHAGAQVTIANRSRQRAQALADELGCASCSLEEALELPYEILVNGTSVGMNEERSPWPKEAHRPDTAVFDTVYTPLETQLLREAEMAGCRCQDGLRMFIKQAAAQYERWLGRQAPELVMQRVALERLSPGEQLLPEPEGAEQTEGDSAGGDGEA